MTSPKAVQKSESDGEITEETDIVRAYEGLQDELENRGIKPPIIICLPSTDGLPARSRTVIPRRSQSRMDAELEYQDLTSKYYYGCICKGHFCNLAAIDIPGTDLDYRYNLAKRYITLGAKSGYSPYMNKRLIIVPDKIKEFAESKSANFQALPKANVSLKRVKEQCPLCFRCFVIYSNIKKVFT